MLNLPLLIGGGIGAQFGGTVTPVAPSFVSSSTQQIEALIAQPDLWPYGFVGGLQPYAPRRIPASLIAVPVNNPPFLTDAAQMNLPVFTAQPDPTTHVFIGGAQPYVGRTMGPLISMEAAAFLARTSGLDNTHKNAYTVLINSLVSGGVWRLMDVIYVLATQDATTAGLNLVSTNFTLTVNGAPTFTADSGYVGGAASQYLDTGFNPTSGSPNYTQNSASAFIWTLDTIGAGADSGPAWGKTTATATAIYSIYPHFTDNNMYGNINDGGLSTASNGSAHLYGMSRNADSGTNSKFMWQATTSAGQNQVSTAILSSTMMFLADSFASARRPFLKNLAFACAGGNLSTAQQTVLYNAVHLYMQTIAGAA